MTSSLRNQLIKVADEYAAARRISRARVSTIVFNAGAALARIASGKDLTTGTYERAMKWFSMNWPENTPWPQGIDRPQKSKSSREDS